MSRKRILVTQVFALVFLLASKCTTNHIAVVCDDDSSMVQFVPELTEVGRYEVIATFEDTQLRCEGENFADGRIEGGLCDPTFGELRVASRREITKTGADETARSIATVIAGLQWTRVVSSAQLEVKRNGEVLKSGEVTFKERPLNEECPESTFVDGDFAL